MKFFTSAFLATALCTTFAVATTTNLDVETPPETPVSVKVKCDVVDFTKLSFSENTLAGHVLEDAYNSIHASYDNDDSTLNGLTYRGSGSSMAGDAVEEENLKWPFPHSTKFSVWYGSWDCTVCPKDDDATIVKAWENKFVAGLLESTHEAFQKVKTCKIDMSPSTPAAIADLPNVDIDLSCGKNKDLSTLSVSQGTFLAHALQSTYNKVHADAANDDSNLDHVFFHASPTMSKFMLGDAADVQGAAPWYNRYYQSKWNHDGFITATRSPGLSGWWGCRLCPHQDDEILGVTLATAGSGAALKAWESKLLVAFQQSPFEFFRNMDKCNIKLLPHSLTEEADEASDGAPCGIRGGCEGVTEN